MTIVYATDEMKKDVESLIRIAREDNIEGCVNLTGFASYNVPQRTKLDICYHCITHKYKQA